MTKHTILFLAANPVGTDRLALDREARAIQVELERSGHRDQFELVTRWAAEPLDLLRELRKLKPTVVHFSGHGTSNVADAHGVGEAPHRDVVQNGALDPAQHGLYFQSSDGRPHLVSAEALARVFGAAGSSVKLVVLSACYSDEQAEALLAYVECVVGMRGSIRDDAARNFAIGFYGGLGEHESVTTAYRQGCAAICLEGLPNEDKPRLSVRDGMGADQALWLNLTSADPAARQMEVCPVYYSQPPSEHNDMPNLQQLLPAGAVHQVVRADSGKRFVIARNSRIAVAFALLTLGGALLLTLLIHENSSTVLVEKPGASIIAILPESDSLTSADQSVLELKTAISTLRGDFELVSSSERKDSSTLATKTKDRALRYGIDILTLDEKMMHNGHIIAKWEYGAYAYAMAASLENDKMECLRLAREAERAARYSLTLLTWVDENSRAGDPEFRSLKKFHDENADFGRVRYLLALALALQAKSGGPVSSAEVKRAIGDIPESFVIDWPLMWNPTLASFAEPKAGLE